MPIILFNKHANPDYSWCDEVVRCVRPHLLSNPTPITRLRTREAAIAAFRTYFDRVMRYDTPERREILRLAALHVEGKTIGLLCVCSPLACHTDLIKARIIEIASTLVIEQD